MEQTSWYPCPSQTYTHTNTHKEAQWNIGVVCVQCTTPQLFLSPNFQGERDLGRDGKKKRRKGSCGWTRWGNERQGGTDEGHGWRCSFVRFTWCAPVEAYNSSEAVTEWRRSVRSHFSDVFKQTSDNLDLTRPECCLCCSWLGATGGSALMEAVR